MLDDKSPDFRYYVTQGWFDSGYYYPSRLGLMKGAAGRLFDRIGARPAEAEEKAVYYG